MKAMNAATTLIALLSSPLGAVESHDHQSGSATSKPMTQNMQEQMEKMSQHMLQMEQMIQKIQGSVDKEQMRSMMQSHMEAMESGMQMMKELHVMDQKQRRDCTYNTSRRPALACKHPPSPQDSQMDMMEMMMQQMLERQKLMGM